MSDVQSNEITEPLSAQALHEALIAGSDHAELCLGPGNLRFTERIVGDETLLLVAFNYSCNRGSIGVREADQLVAAFRRARETKRAVVLLMETSGIRVTDGTHGIASLRRLIREISDARLDRVPMLAMVIGSAFGGASLLSAVCDTVIINPECHFSMSGPKLLEAAAGPKRFPSTDGETVIALLGGMSRARSSSLFRLCEPRAISYVRELEKWLRADKRPTVTPQTLLEQNRVLRQRLKDVDRPQNGTPHLKRAMIEAMKTLGKAGEGSQGQASVLFWGRADDGRRILTFAAPNGASAYDVINLTEALLSFADNGDVSSGTVLFVDCPTHSLDPHDEQPVLSELLANLALAIRCLHRVGHQVEAVVTDSGGGGIQGAIGGGATSVRMLPRARLYVLPQVAMAALNKLDHVDEGNLEIAISSGAVDGVFPPSS